MFDGIRVQKGERAVALRVKIYQKNALSCERQSGGEVNGCGRFTNPSFLIGDGYNHYFLPPNESFCSLMRSAIPVKQLSPALIKWRNIRGFSGQIHTFTAIRLLAEAMDFQYLLWLNKSRVRGTRDKNRTRALPNHKGDR